MKVTDSGKRKVELCMKDAWKNTLAYLRVPSK